MTYVVLDDNRVVCRESVFIRSFEEDALVAIYAGIRLNVRLGLEQGVETLAGYSGAK
jgi:hypothetical protein